MSRRDRRVAGSNSTRDQITAGEIVADPMRPFQTTHIGTHSKFGDGLATDTAIHQGKLPSGDEAMLLSGAMSALPRETQMFILNKLHHGALTLDDAKLAGGTRLETFLALAAILPADRQMKIANAFTGTGHLPKEAVDFVDDQAEKLMRQHDALETSHLTMATVIAEMEAMAKNPTLQRIAESCYYKVIEAVRAGKIMMPVAAGNDGHTPIDKDATRWAKDLVTTISKMPEFGIFLIQHNWDAAFAKAKDFEGGEWKLPYPVTVFELRISGRRCCLVCMHDDDEAFDNMALFIESSVGWVAAGLYTMDAGGIHDIMPGNVAIKANGGIAENSTDKIVKVIIAQARAACIALEAEVAETELVRAPHKLNHKRERAGKLPLYDFHIINLAARKRYNPRLSESGDIEDEHRHRRLHFVRGHYRTYVNHRTYVKWHLRGDPDLGFVDKEYRL